VNPYLKIPCWSRAWPPGRTTSMTWTSCGTAPWQRCSAGSGRRPPWGRSCGRFPGATCASWTPSPAGPCRGWRRQRQWWTARRRRWSPASSAAAAAAPGRTRWKAISW